MSLTDRDIALIQGSLRQELQELDILEEASNIPINANATNVEVIPETSIEAYKYKTVSIRADYALTFKLYAYDDPNEFDTADLYYTANLTANRTSTYSFEEDFRLAKVLVDNPNTVGHTVTRCRVKGRRL